VRKQESLARGRLLQQAPECKERQQQQQQQQQQHQLTVESAAGLRVLIVESAAGLRVLRIELHSPSLQPMVALDMGGKSGNLWISSHMSASELD